MERPAYRFRFGSAEYDESRFELRVAGLPVEAERRALDVLAYLLQHAGEVVTKEELLREVWAGRVTVDKVLPNAINKLRRALGEANASHITTQARVGYRLDGAVTRTAVGRHQGSALELRVGQPVPGRPSFVLREQIGRTDGSEVWLADHQKTREQRVYKFALDADRLRALKREVTLLRVLQEGLDDTRGFVEALDWNFELPPYFIECRYGGETLLAWSARHLDGLDTAGRIALFLQIADAVAAAHALGVLHKDLKPANVLVSGDAMQPQVRLTDFGSGRLLEPDRLQQLGITRLGMTVEDGTASDASSGTPLYIAPELFAGQSPTVQSDVFALGILLYQLLTGRIGHPMASGWEAEIGDELLRDDLRLATDGNPARRLGSVSELVTRLRHVEQRRAEARVQRLQQEAARRDRESLGRARARRPLLVALVAALATGLAVTTWLGRQAAGARDAARVELARANALTRFLNEDLIGRSNPLVSAKGPEATLREVLTSARDRVPTRFRDQPHTAAEIHGSLAALFGAVDLQQEAETHARAALALLAQPGDAGASASPRALLQAQAVLVRALGRAGRYDEAQTQLATLEKLAAAAGAAGASTASAAVARHHLASARSTLLLGRGEFVKAGAELRSAIEALDAAEPDNTAARDGLRLDLVSALALATAYAEARTEGERLIAEAQRRAGDNELLIALARLALVRAQKEDHAAAEALLLQAQPVIVARLGAHHSRHITLLNELLGVSFRRGDWPRAVVYAQSVHERARAKFGDDHASTYVTLVNWARTLSESGRADLAGAKARQAHEELQRLLGPSAPSTQDALFVRALIELDNARTAQALPLIERLEPAVLEATRATGQWQHGVDALRGIALQQRGDGAAARPLLDSALAALQGEETLAQPSRLYVMTQKSRAALR